MPTLAYRTAFVALACVLCAPAANAALPQRTFVASYGVDTNACSLVSPCRSFATAISKTNPTGEVIVLDSAGYGPVTITQSVTITAPPGVYAGITVPTSTTGIVVNGAGAISVTLRGLTLNGLGGGGPGINFQNGSRLVVDRCVIENMQGRGIISTAAASQLYISDTDVRYASAYAIDVEEGVATIDRVHLENNAAGVLVASFSTNPVNVLVRDSVASNNINWGFAIGVVPVSGSARLEVERSIAYGSGNDGVSVGAFAGPAVIVISDSRIIGGSQSGIHASGSAATVVVSGTTISGNSRYGLEQDSSASLSTLKNNSLEQNGLGATLGSILPATLQ
jgi:hypothetical protein